MANKTVLDPWWTNAHSQIRTRLCWPTLPQISKEKEVQSWFRGKIGIAITRNCSRSRSVERTSKVQPLPSKAWDGTWSDMIWRETARHGINHRLQETELHVILVLSSAGSARLFPLGGYLRNMAMSSIQGSLKILRQSRLPGSRYACIQWRLCCMHELPTKRWDHFSVSQLGIGVFLPGPIQSLEMTR